MKRFAFVLGGVALSLAACVSPVTPPAGQVNSPTPAPSVTPSGAPGPTPTPSAPATPPATPTPTPTPKPTPSPLQFATQTQLVGGNGTSGDFSAVTTNGTAAKASFQPANAAVALANGELVFSEIGSGRVGRLSPPFTDPNPGEPAYRIATVLLDQGKGLRSMADLVQFQDGYLVSDTFAHTIYKLSNDGKLTPFAGNGTVGYSGDGRAALDAQMASPMGLAVDAKDNVYIADMNNHIVRMVNKEGIISTLAGLPGVAAESTSFTSGGKNLYQPRLLAASPDGVVYVYDARKQLRKVNPDHTLTVVAGAGGTYENESTVDGRQVGGFLALGQIASMRFGPDGLLYYADPFNHQIRRFLSEEKSERVAGNGKAEGFPYYLAAPADTTVPNPTALTLASNGDLFYFEASTFRWITLPAKK